MNPNIAIIAGGNSSEIVISVQSGQNIFNAINQSKFKPWFVHMQENNWEVFENGISIAQIDKSNFSFTYKGKTIKFDFAYISIHGTPGEDGILQGYFDLLKIPYSTGGVQSSALTFNKWFCSNYLRNFNIPIAKSLRLKKGNSISVSEIITQLALPVFVKPNAGGSSFGITKVKKEEELVPAIEKAWEESDEALVEEFIEGTEYTCGLVKFESGEEVFPVTEILPKNEFFDFEAKYTAGAAEEVTPARLPEAQFKECQALSSKIYDLCNCSGIVRVDFILKNDTFYFLEINTTPGMTSTSFIPQQIEAHGLKLKDILSQVINEKFVKNLL